jgi:hypothetical protein
MGMFTKTIAALGGAMVLALLGSGSALAQGAPSPGGITTGGEILPPSQTAVGIGDELSVPNRDVTPSRLPNERRARQRFSESAQALRRGGTSGPDYTAVAQGAVNAAGVRCDVTEASHPGVTVQQEAIYEVACATGPGYIVVSSQRPRTHSCLEVEGRAAATRMVYTEADVGQQCQLPANQNSLAVIGGWARDAGVNCTIDQAIDIGKNDRGNALYEIGCAGADGYWLEKAGNGWTLVDCLEMASAGETCRFTTDSEQAASFAAKLAGTEAAGCEVTDVRLVGMGSGGRYYEAKCAAEGEGYIAKVDASGRTQQVYPCTAAQSIAGGCTLTRTSSTS